MFAELSSGAYLFSTCFAGNIPLNPFNKLRKLILLIPLVSTEDRSTSPDLRGRQHNGFLE